MNVTRNARVVVLLFFASIAAAALVYQFLPHAPHATVLTVGRGKRFKNPGAASVVAQSGDIVEIFPGVYDDCAVWPQNDLTIEGMGKAVTIENRACIGKGAFVIHGNNVTVRNITSGACVRLRIMVRVFATRAAL